MKNRPNSVPRNGQPLKESTDYKGKTLERAKGFEPFQRFRFSPIYWGFSKFSLSVKGLESCWQLLNRPIPSHLFMNNFAFLKPECPFYDLFPNGVCPIKNIIAPSIAELHGLGKQEIYLVDLEKVGDAVLSQIAQRIANKAGADPIMVFGEIKQRGLPLRVSQTSGCSTDVPFLVMKLKFTAQYFSHSRVTACYRDGIHACLYDHKGQYFAVVRGDPWDEEAYQWLKLYLRIEAAVGSPAQLGTYHSLV